MSQLWSRVLLETLTVAQVVKKLPAFMEPKGSLSCSQKPALVPIPSHMNPIHVMKPCKVKIKFSLCLTKHRTMMRYEEMEV